MEELWWRKEPVPYPSKSTHGQSQPTNQRTNNSAAQGKRYNYSYNPNNVPRRTTQQQGGSQQQGGQQGWGWSQQEGSQQQQTSDIQQQIRKFSAHRGRSFPGRGRIHRGGRGGTML